MSLNTGQVVTRERQTLSGSILMGKHLALKLSWGRVARWCRTKAFRLVWEKLSVLRWAHSKSGRVIKVNCKSRSPRRTRSKTQQKSIWTSGSNTRSTSTICHSPIEKCWIPSLNLGAIATLILSRKLARGQCWTLRFLNLKRLKLSKSPLEMTTLANFQWCFPPPTLTNNLS